jgi:hypothetical protein
VTEPATWGEPETVSTAVTNRYGHLEARAWEHLHSRLTHRAAWIGNEGALPVIEGTLMRLATERLRRTGAPQPLWLWTSAQGLDPALLESLWSAWLRRFDLEHTFGFLNQTLGWTVPGVRDPESADRWTWLVIAAFTQLGLARELAADLRLPWEAPARAGRLTPARVRRDFRTSTRPCPAWPGHRNPPSQGRAALRADPTAERHRSAIQARKPSETRPSRSDRSDSPAPKVKNQARTRRPDGSFRSSRRSPRRSRRP